MPRKASVTRIRGRARGGARFDPTSSREVLKDRRLFASLGKVVQPSSGAPHYEIINNDPHWGTDVMVFVHLIPQDVVVFARLGGGGGCGFGSGVWAIPAPGTEVYVKLPEGEISGDPVVVGVLVSGTVPHQLAPNVMIVQAPPGGQVIIHDGADGAQALATKSDIDALQSWVGSHTHSGGTIMGNTGGPQPPGPPGAAGTGVLKAK